MQPISESDDDLDDTIQICVTASVISSDAEASTFIIHGTQYVARAGCTDDIAICGQMNKNRRWLKPNQLLPDLKSIITFHGILDKFDSYTPPTTNKKTTCVIITVDDITYILTPPKKLSSTNKPAARQKIKTHTQKFNTSQSMSNPSASQDSQHPSLPSTSHKKLGKRKANNSEEEVDERIKKFACLSN